MTVISNSFPWLRLQLKFTERAATWIRELQYFTFFFSGDNFLKTVNSSHGVIDRASARGTPNSDSISPVIPSATFHSSSPSSWTTLEQFSPVYHHHSFLFANSRALFSTVCLFLKGTITQLLESIKWEKQRQKRRRRNSLLLQLQLKETYWHE